MAVLLMVVVAAASGAVALALSAGTLPPLAALLAAAQLAVLAPVLMRQARRTPLGLCLAAAAAAGALALAICLAAPRAGPAAVAAATHAAIYGGLLLLFGRSLRSGREPVATQVARRVHAQLTAARLAYTRGVTWMWTGFFAIQLLVSAVFLAASPFVQPPWFITRADLPLAALLFAAELAYRSWRFRGQPHSSAADMLRAFIRRDAAAPENGQSG